MMYENQRSFSGNLHALRGLAAVSVVIFHAEYIGSKLNVGYLGIVDQLGAGVTLFFILSGFSLALSNYDKTELPGWLRGYAIRRMARIVPVWVLFVLIHLVFQFHTYGKTYNKPTIISNVIPVYSLVPGRHESIVWAGWTIGVEVLFYILLPFLLVLNRHNTMLWFAALVAAMYLSIGFSEFSPSGLTPSYYYMAFQHQLFVFILGSTIYFVTLWARQTGRENGALALFLAMAILGFSWWTMAVYRVPGFALGSWALAVKALSLGGAVAVFYLAQDRVNIFNSGTKFLGDKSYTIYLAHPIVVAMTKPLYKWISKVITIPELSFLAYSSVVLVITFGVAAIISNTVEEPIYKWGCKLARRAGREESTGSESKQPLAAP